MIGLVGVVVLAYCYVFDIFVLTEKQAAMLVLAVMAEFLLEIIIVMIIGEWKKWKERNK